MRICAILCAVLLSVSGFSQNRFTFDSGTISFTSEAPLEMIKASANSYQALIDTASGSFAVRMDIRNFVGFNSPLQQTHFYENYMEADTYERASFSGKILEDLHFRDGEFNITLKGELNIHGIKKTRVVEAVCVWKDEQTLEIRSNFQVPLVDHGIQIPRMVYQKIAEIIDVNVRATLVPLL